MPAGSGEQQSDAEQSVLQDSSAIAAQRKVGPGAATSNNYGNPHHTLAHM